MIGELLPAGNGRHLAIVRPDDAVELLTVHGAKPLAALLTAQDAHQAPAELEPLIEALLSAGCEYFVCAGLAAEALHDRIDDLIVDQLRPGAADPVTTWHTGERDDEVVDFFFGVAAPKHGTLMVAVLGTGTAALRTLLTEAAVLAAGS